MTMWPNDCRLNHARKYDKMTLVKMTVDKITVDEMSDDKMTRCHKIKKKTFKE